MLSCGVGEIELLQNLFVALKELDGVPAVLFLGQIVYRDLLDMGQGMLHRAAELVHGDGLGALGGLHGGLGGGLNAVALQGGDLHHLTAELTGELLDVDHIALAAYNVHHVDGHHHRDAQLRELGGEIEVPFQIGAVHDVQNRVGPLLNQIVSRDHFLQRVGGEGVDAGQVCDDHAVKPFELALLLFHRDAGPVAHELGRACQRVKQRCLAAVGVARKRNANVHNKILSP